MQKREVQALLRKEWIKSKPYMLILLLMLVYAGADSFLILKTMYNRHEGFGLFYTLLEKQPLFFESFKLLIVAGAMLGIFQILPEARENRLRLFFHTPVSPLKMIAVCLASSFIVLFILNLLSHLILIGVMRYYHLPADIMVPVLKTLGSWTILSFIAMTAGAALIANSSISCRAGVLASFWVAYTFMGETKSYALNSGSFFGYLCIGLLFVLLVYYAFLDFLPGLRNQRSYKLFRGAALLLVVISLSQVLPRLYWRTVDIHAPKLNLYFSPVKNEFILYRSLPDKKSLTGASQLVHQAEDGTELNRRDVAMALPFLRAFDLIKWQLFPKEIRGKKIPARLARAAWTYGRYKPRDWNRPSPMLHIMFESIAEGAKLEMPDDFFRIARNGAGIEFILPESGKVDEQKSSLFNEALREAGFIFPVGKIAGNPNPKKDYDEGYLLVDAENQFFQLKMERGQPFCRKSQDILKGEVRGVAVEENRLREILGIVATDSAVYAVYQQTLNLVPLPIKDFSPDETSFVFYSDLVCKYLTISNVKKENWQAPLVGIATAPDFTVERTLEVAKDAKYLAALKLRKKVASFLFPVSLLQYNPSTVFKNLHFVPAEYFWLATAGNIFFLLLFLVILRIRKKQFNPMDAVFIAIFGSVAFLTVLLWRVKRPLRFGR